MTDFSILPMKAQTRLAQISDVVSGVVPIETRLWKIQTQFLAEGGQEPGIVSEVKEWFEKRCLYLYTFQIASENIDPSILVSAYSHAKETKKGSRAYARLNPASANQASTCMYVGSSEKIHQRLKDHLGFGAKEIFAIHLAYWASSIGIELNFECAKYPTGTSKIALQALEDTLWEELLPIFGRQGAR